MHTYSSVDSILLVIGFIIGMVLANIIIKYCYKPAEE